MMFHWMWWDGSDTEASCLTELTIIHDNNYKDDRLYSSYLDHGSPARPAGSHAQRHHPGPSVLWAPRQLSFPSLIMINQRFTLPVSVRAIFNPAHASADKTIDSSPINCESKQKRGLLWMCFPLFSPIRSTTLQSRGHWTHLKAFSVAIPSIDITIDCWFALTMSHQWPPSARTSTSSLCPGAHPLIVRDNNLLVSIPL